jgi:hypothetical protein
VALTGKRFKFSRALGPNYFALIKGYPCPAWFFVNLAIIAVRSGLNIFWPGSAALGILFFKAFFDFRTTP